MSVTGSKTSTGMKNHYALDKSIESLKISKKKSFSSGHHKLNKGHSLA